MAINVSELLRNWDLESCIEKFKREEIDDESFLLLTTDNIYKLIPETVQREKFATKFAEFKSDLGLLVEHETPPSSSIDFLEDIIDDDIRTMESSVEEMTDYLLQNNISDSMRMEPIEDKDDFTLSLNIANVYSLSSCEPDIDIGSTTSSKGTSTSGTNQQRYTSGESYVKDLPSQIQQSKQRKLSEMMKEEANAVHCDRAEAIKVDCPTKRPLNNKNIMTNGTSSLEDAIALEDVYSPTFVGFECNVETSGIVNDCEPDSTLESNHSPIEKPCSAGKMQITKRKASTAFSGEKPVCEGTRKRRRIGTTLRNEDYPISEAGKVTLFWDELKQKQAQSSPKKKNSPLTSRTPPRRSSSSPEKKNSVLISTTPKYHTISPIRRITKSNDLKIEQLDSHIQLQVSLTRIQTNYEKRESSKNNLQSIVKGVDDKIPVSRKQKPSVVVPGKSLVLQKKKQKDPALVHVDKKIPILKKHSISITVQNVEDKSPPVLRKQTVSLAMQKVDDKQKVHVPVRERDESPVSLKPKADVVSRKVDNKIQVSQKQKLPVTVREVIDSPVKQKVNVAVRKVDDKSTVPIKQKVGAAVRKGDVKSPIPRKRKISKPETVHDMQKWLCDHDEPQDTVAKYMAETIKQRRNYILFRKRNPSIDMVFKTWPKLLNADMIDQDFSLIYSKQQSESFCMKFKSIAKDIMNATYYEAADANELYQELKNEISALKVLDGDEVINAALHMLPVLLPQDNTIRVKNWKKSSFKLPTTAVARTCFIDTKECLKAGECIRDVILSNEDKIRSQPYIISTGNRLSPTQVFVIIESHSVLAPSLLKAVDMCFKLHYIFHFEYSKACRNVWRFFDSAFYMAEENELDLPTCIIELKKQLKC